MDGRKYTLLKLQEDNPSFNPDCPACVEQWTHDAVEWVLHPLAGHGFSPESGWTHEELRKGKVKLLECCARSAVKIKSIQDLGVDYAGPVLKQQKGDLAGKSHKESEILSTQNLKRKNASSVTRSFP